MNPIRELKNGEYDLHLSFEDAYMFRSLLKRWCDEYTEKCGTGRAETKQDRFLKYFNEALHHREEELIEHSLTYESKFRREYLGQFLDDNNPEGYKTKSNWMQIDKI